MWIMSLYITLTGLYDSGDLWSEKVRYIEVIPQVLLYRKIAETVPCWVLWLMGMDVLWHFVRVEMGVDERV